MNGQTPTLVVPPLTLTTDPEITEQALVEIALTAISNGSATVGALAEEAVPLEWIVAGMIPRGVLLFFAGPPKISKSFVCIDLCYCVSRGLPFIGHAVEKGKSWYINLEDGRKRLAYRSKQLGYERDASDADFLVTYERSALQHVMTVLESSRPAPDLVVIDPMIWIELLLGVENENDAQAVTQLLARLQTIVQKKNISMVIPHHFSKAGDKVRGSSAFEAATDGWLTVAECEDKVRLLSWTLRDGAAGKAAYDVEFDNDNNTAAVRVRDTNTATPVANGNGSRPRSDDALCRAKILAVLPSDDVISQNKISVASGVRKPRLGPLLLAMESEGLVTTGPGGKGWTRTEQPKVGSLVCVTEDTEARD